MGNYHKKRPYPSVSITFVDETFVSIATESFTTCIQVITSDRGPDNVLTKISDPTDFVNMFGSPDIKKHGQAAANLFRWLSAGGDSYVLRVTDAYPAYEDLGLVSKARLANMTLSVAVSIDDTDKKNKKLYAQTLITSQDLKNAEDLIIKQSTIDSTDPVPKTYDVFPIMSFYSPGRSDFYNDFAIRLEIIDDYDAVMNFRVYSLTIIKKNNNGTDSKLYGPVYVSLEKTARDSSNESMYIEDVFKRYIVGFGELMFHEKMWDKLAERLDIDVAYLDIVSGSETKNVKIWEMNDYTTHYWSECENKLDPYEPLPNYEDLRNSDMRLSLGHSGDLDNSEKMKIDAYKGIVDPIIVDIIQRPAHMLLDANETVNTKIAMAELAYNIRQDLVCILDTGFTANARQALSLRETELAFNTPFVSIFTQDFIVYDNFSTTDKKVTSTYFLADKIVANDIAYNGRHKNFVGPRRGVIAGFKTLNWVPSDSEKADLYNNQINYIEVSPKRVNFINQSTTQKLLSQLSNLNHMRTLLDIERMVYEVAETYRMEDIDQETMDSLQSDLANQLSVFLSNGAVVSLIVAVTATDYQRKIKECSVEVSFIPKDILERINATIIVKRSS